MAASAIAAMAMMSLGALGGALVLLTGTEATIAATYRDSVQAQHAAEALLEATLLELAEADWTAVAAGVERGTAGSAPPFVLEAEDGGWQLYANGSLPELVPGADAGGAISHIYGVVWVQEEQPAAEMLRLRAAAYGLRRVRRTVEVAIARGDEGIRVLWWGEAN